MKPIYLAVTDGDGTPASLLLLNCEDGFVRVKRGQDDEVVTAIDDLPAEWIKELNKWNIFGRRYEQLRGGQPEGNP